MIDNKELLRQITALQDRVAAHRDELNRLSRRSRILACASISLAVAVIISVGK
jgi:hypothetical protein